MNREISKAAKTAVKYIVLCLIMAVFLFPIYWMLVSSFRTNSQLLRLPPNFTPVGGNFSNYIKIFSVTKYINYFKNSVIVATSSVFISMLVSIFAAFAFSRYDFPCKNLLQASILNIQIFPVTVIMISLFTFFTKLHLMNSYLGIILADITYSLPFTVWFLKSFFDTIPKSLDESAKIDGCGRLRTLLTIIVPLLKPGLVAIGIYTFLNSWDDFLFALTILKSDALKTLPVGIAQSFMGEFVEDYAGMMTLSVIASAPVVIAFIFTQKYMVAGLTSGAVKG